MQFEIMDVEWRDLRDVLKGLKEDVEDPWTFLDLFSLTLDDQTLLWRCWLRRKTSSNSTLLVRSQIPMEQKESLPSATDLWPSIRYYEEEYISLYGVKFIGLADSRLFKPVLLRSPEME